MMLDMKRTFDEVIEAHASPEKAQQILDNPFYQALSSSFAGTQEYMAMEKLGQLRARADADPDGWDLIVVDTPPSRSALDFLDAPQRLGSFLDGRLIRILSAPAKAGGRAYLKVVSAGGRDGDRGADQAARRPDAARRADLRRRAGHGVRRVPRAGRTAPTGCCRPTGRRSSWSRPPSRTPCGRRPTSSNGSSRAACRWPGWCSTGCTPRRGRGPVGRAGPGRGGGPGGRRAARR